MQENLECFFNSEAETTTFAMQFAQAVEPLIEKGFSVYLSGELGAGKTFFTQRLLAAWGYKGIVKSPTYGLVEMYALPIGNICHFDLYRLNTADELEDIGFRDYWGEGQLCLVEWPSHGGEVLPLPDVALLLQATQKGFCTRQLSLVGISERGVELLRVMKAGVKK